MREELPGLHWMVPLCNGIMVDAVHPQSGKYQTACATVQGHMEYSEVVVFRRYNKGERLSSYLAMVTASFTMAKSMNAVVTMGAINAVYLSWSTDNSGLPLNWQGGLLTKKAVSTMKHWDLPSLGIHNTKVVYHRHMDSNSTNAYCCVIQVKFAPTSGPMTSSFCHLQWESQSNHGGSVGITIRAPKSLKWNLHQERSDVFG